MAIGAPDVRVSVFNPLGTLILADVSADFAGGQLMYEQTPAGCGAAQFTLGLRYEEAFARGYWTARNIIEISSGDDTLQVAIGSAATKLYVTGTQAYDTSVGQDTGQIYLWDGSTLTMRIPVTGVGVDAGGPYITVGSPLGGGAISTYAQGTIIGRRRYCGRITQRPLTNQLLPNTQITCEGMLNRLSEAYGTFTIGSNASVDCGAAMYGCINQFFAISRFPELTIGGSFPNVGCNYAGAASDTSVLSMCQNILNAISTGDQWQLYVGHDRVVKLVKLYTNSSNSYTYNLTLPQGVTYFEPVNVLNTDQVTASQVNSVKVIGATDPSTQQPVNAVEQDGTSITDYGQIDAQPVMNYSVKTVAQAQAMATALLNQYSAPQANGQFRVYTGPNAIPASKNLVLDSEFLNLPPASGALWSASGAGSSFSFAAAAGPNNSNAIHYVGTGSVVGGYLTSCIINVTPGETITVSGWIDATHVSGATPNFGLYNPGVSTAYALASATNGSAGYVSATWTVTSGVTQVVVLVNLNNCTVASGQTISWSQPQVEQNSIATSYQSSEPISGRPMGLDNGDVVLGVQNVTVSRFDGTGAVKNLAPDSEFQYFPTVVSAVDALWVTAAGPFGVVGGGPNGSNMIQYTGTGSRANGYFFGGYIDVVPGQVLTISGYIYAQSVTSNVSGPGASWRIFNYPVPTVAYATAAQTPGVDGRVSATFTVPAGVTKVMVLADTGGAVVTNTDGLWWSQPQVEVGGSATSYVPNYGAPPLYGLVSSAQTTIVPGGYSYQDVYFSAIEPDWGSVIAQRANAQQTAITLDQLQAPGLSQYFVSPNAWPSAGPATSGLVVTVSTFEAVFASGTQPVQVGGNTFTCTANATNWAWITSGNTWTIRTDTSFVSGGILYGIFQAGSSSILGATPKVTVGNLGQPMSYLLNNSAFTPTFTSISITQAVTGPLTSQVNVGFSVTNQPTDGSFSKTRLWYRQSGQTSWILLGDQAPNNASGTPQAINGPFSAVGLYLFKFPDAANGVAYEFGCSLESSASTETSIVSLGTITPSSNSTPGSSGITVPGSALPPYSTNLLSDSNFYNSPFNGSNIAASSSYWIFQLIDGSSFSVKKGQAADGSNYLCWTSGASGSNRYGYSRPVAVVTGQTYVLSAYFDARNVTGSNLPFVGIYDYTSGSLGSQLAHVTQAAGTNGRIQTYWTATGGVTAVVLMLSDGSATINSSTSGGAPGFLVGATPQLELSATSPGYASSYQPTTGVNPNGTQANTAMSAGSQLRVTDDVGTLNVSSSAGTVVGNLPQANHDPTVVLSSVTGTQKNLVPDSGFMFGSGGNGTSYWSNGVYWDIGGTNAPNAIILFNGIGNGSNAIDFTNPNTSANSQFVQGQAFYCAAGTYTMSCVAYNSQSSGNILAAVLTVGTAVNVGQIAQTPGGTGRISGQITIPASGQYYFFFTMNGSNGASGAQSFFANPQLESGSVMTAYQQTGVPDIAGTIAHGAMSPGVQGAVTSGAVLVGQGAVYDANFNGSATYSVPSPITLPTTFSNAVSVVVPGNSSEQYFCEIEGVFLPGGLSYTAGSHNGFNAIFNVGSGTVISSAFAEAYVDLDIASNVYILIRGTFLCVGGQTIQLNLQIFSKVSGMQIAPGPSLTSTFNPTKLFIARTA